MIYSEKKKEKNKIRKISGDRIKRNSILMIGFASVLACQALMANPACFTPARHIQYQPILLKPKIPSAYLQAGNPPVLEKAYQKYCRTGHAPNILQDGFVQFAYGAQQPIIPASPFEIIGDYLRGP